MRVFYRFWTKNTAGKTAWLLLISLALCILSAPFGLLPAQQTVCAIDPPNAVSASAALLVEGDTGQILFEQDAHKQLYPASTTKIMTALLVMEAIAAGVVSMSDEITASSAMVNSVIWDASHVSPRIKIGETLTVRDYLYCVMLDSDCASCNILAEHVSGSVGAFVAQMNVRAAELGCDSTHFVNTHGYPDANHYTTAWSLYLISAEAMRYPDFAEIVSTKYHQIPETNLAKARDLYNTNLLLHNVSSTDYYLEGASGIKTGTTDDAGYCLCATAERDGMTLFSVVLGAAKVERSDGTNDRQSFSESKRLLEWGFESYAYRDVLSEDKPVATMDVKHSGGVDADIVPVSSSSVLLASDAKTESEMVLLTDQLTAPVAAGTEVGHIYIRQNGSIIAQSKLIVRDTIDEHRGIDLLLFWLGHFNTISPILLINLAILIIVTIIFITDSRSARKQAKRPRRDPARRPDRPKAAASRSLIDRTPLDDPLLGLPPLTRQPTRWHAHQHGGYRHDDHAAPVLHGYSESPPDDDVRYLPARTPYGYDDRTPLVPPSEYYPPNYPPPYGSPYPPDSNPGCTPSDWGANPGWPYC